MAFERITAKFGRTEDRETYPDTDDFEAPQDVADPHTLEDDTHDTLFERATDNWVPIVAFGLLGLVTLVLLGIYAGRYFVTALTDPWVQRGLAAALIFGAGLKMGIQRERGAVEREQELTLDTPGSEDGPTFRGEYRTVDGADYPVFVPFKGNRGLLGGDPEPYRLADLSQTLVNNHGHDPQKEVKIRLHPAVLTVTQTDRGTRIVQQTGGLEPVPQGADAHVEATLPDNADEGTVAEMTELLEQQDEELDQMQKKVNVLRRQRDEARRMARMTFEEYQDMMEDQAGLFTQFLPQRRQRSDDEERSSRAAERVERLANGGDQ